MVTVSYMQTYNWVTPDIFENIFIPYRSQSIWKTPHLIPIIQINPKQHTKTQCMKWQDIDVCMAWSFNYHSRLFLFFSLLRKPRALDFTIGAWQQRAFELNHGITTSVPTVINCRAILTRFIGNSPRLPYPFIGIVLSFGSSAQSQKSEAKRS